MHAFGTAPLRTAENAQDFLEKAGEIIGIRPQTIPGDREAELIHKGLCRAVPFPDNRVLIMDIGGGSVEFIIADHRKVYWQKSFPIGAAVLWRAFQHEDPITAEEIQYIENHLDIALTDLWVALDRLPCPTLVGASGTLDDIDLFLLDTTDETLAPPNRFTNPPTQHIFCRFAIDFVGRFCLSGCAPNLGTQYAQ